MGFGMASERFHNGEYRRTPDRLHDSHNARGEFSKTAKNEGAAENECAAERNTFLSRGMPTLSQGDKGAMGAEDAFHGGIPLPVHVRMPASQHPHPDAEPFWPARNCLPIQGCSHSIGIVLSY